MSTSLTWRPRGPPASTPPATARPAAGSRHGRAAPGAAGSAVCRSRCRTPWRRPRRHRRVRPPGTTSTSGIRCGGLNGCPMTTRSGWCGQAAWMALGSNPDELLAMTTSCRVAASRTANSSFLIVDPFGPVLLDEVRCRRRRFRHRSRTRAGRWRRRRPGRAAARIGQCAATSARSLCSASGDGSVAITSSPWARKWAAQLAPMTPVPTTATRRT